MIQPGFASAVDVELELTPYTVGKVKGGYTSGTQQNNDAIAGKRNTREESNIFEEKEARSLTSYCEIVWDLDVM